MYNYDIAMAVVCAKPISSPALLICRAKVVAAVSMQLMKKLS